MARRVRKHSKEKRLRLLSVNKTEWKKGEAIQTPPLFLNRTSSYLEIMLMSFVAI
jgi:hypothetical protein